MLFETSLKAFLLCRVQLQQKGMFASYIQLLVQVHFENATLVWPFPQFSSRFLAKKFFLHTETKYVRDFSLFYLSEKQNILKMSSMPGNTFSCLSV